MRAPDGVASPPKVCHHETHLPAFEAAPRAHARVSRPDEHRRRPQGSRRSPGEGPRTPVRLTQPAPAARIRCSAYRLRGAGAFEKLFKLGVRHDAHFLQLIAAPAAQHPGRVGYVIGRKMMMRAVDRNRLRRRLREHVRAARPAVEGFDIILRVRERVRREDIPQAVAESRELLARLAGRAA